MPTEKRTCVYVLADRGHVSSHERTCVRSVEGPTLKRTFQVVPEMQLCAAGRGSDNGNRDIRHFLLARYRLETMELQYFSYRI